VQVGHVFGEIPVRDLAAAREWYELLLGPSADAPVWRLNAGASLALVVDPDRAGLGALTLSVDDLDGFVRAPGVAVGRHGGRSVAITDPDGNAITLREEVSVDAREQGDFHLLVKQRELDRDVAETISRLDEGLTALADAFRGDGSNHAALALEAREHLRSGLPPDVQHLRVTLRMFPPHRPDVAKLTQQLDALDIALRRRQNLGRGEHWVST
jgi:hypothetical protein